MGESLGPSLLGRRGVERAELARNHGAQPFAQLRGLLATVSPLEASLPLRPTFLSALETRVTGLGQAQDLAAPIGRVRLDRDQLVAFEGPDIAPERCTIDDQLGGERVDRHRAVALEPREDPVLGRTQPRGRQIPIVELGDVARGLPHREAVAIGGVWKRSRGHGQPFSDKPCKRAYLVCIYSLWVNAQARRDTASSNRVSLTPPPRCLCRRRLRAASAASPN